MKSYSLNLALNILIGVFCSFLVGCDKEEDGCVKDVHILLNVVDSSGNNLLDEKVSGNILNDGITSQYNNKVYKLEKCPADYFTEKLEGLYYGKQYGGNEQIMYIGCWEGELNYQNKEIIMDWGDETKDTIAFDHISTRKGKWTLDVRLNGKNVQSFILEMGTTNPPITIVK